MPEGARLVVVNATPLISLALIGKLGLLRDLYDQVAVPGAVYAEITAEGPSGMGRVEVPQVDWLQVIQRTNFQQRHDVAHFDFSVPHLLTSVPIPFILPTSSRLEKYDDPNCNASLINRKG